MDAQWLTAECYHLTLVLLPLPTPSFSLTYTSLLAPPPPFTARKAPASCTPPHTSPLSTPLQNRAWESENRRETSSQDRRNHISSPVEKRDFSQSWFGCLGDRARLQGLAHCHTRETHALPHSYTPTPALWPPSKKAECDGEQRCPGTEYRQPPTFTKPNQSQPGSKTLQAGSFSPEDSGCQSRFAHPQITFSTSSVTRPA